MTEIKVTHKIITTRNYILEFILKVFVGIILLSLCSGLGIIFVVSTSDAFQLYFGYYIFLMMVSIGIGYYFMINTMNPTSEDWQFTEKQVVHIINGKRY